MDDKGTQEVEKRELQSKRVYDKPQIIYRAPLEGMAAVCQPIPPGKANGLTCTNLNS